MEVVETDLRDVVTRVTGKGLFDLPQLVLATMHYVEQKAGELHGAAKLAVFKDCIGNVLEYAHLHNLVNDAQYNTLKTVINTGFGMILNMVEVFIALSKNPEWIQLEKEVQACCARICKKK